MSALTPEELTALTNAAGDLYGEAGKCAEAGHWRAALLLIGSALEGAITATACCLEPELRQQGVWPTKKDPDRWTLGEAIHLAKSAGWLPSETQDANFIESLRGEVGDAVRFLTTVRNMAVHPAAHVRELVRPDFADVRHMKATYEICDGIAAAVFDRLSAEINKYA